MHSNRTHLDRRRFLALGGMAAVAVACSSSTGDDDTSEPTASASAPSASSPTTTGPEVAAAATTEVTSAAPATDDPAATSAPSQDDLAALDAADFEGLGVCVLLAETAAGPFPTITQLERRDVTEGYPGHALRLGLRVIDEASAPVPAAVVEIWHADATGDYSSFSDGGGGKDEAEGSAFLRGFQTAGDDGIVEFQTVYPGWYPGRAVHIHLSVHIDGDTALTSQLFFDDAYTEQVYAAEPYAEFGSPDTPNGRDGIAGPAIATGGMLTLASGPTAAGTGTIALTNLGVRA